jgi:hypothetical protein
MESARAMLSARAMESCFDLGGATCAWSALAKNVSAIVDRMKYMNPSENVDYD